LSDYSNKKEDNKKLFASSINFNSSGNKNDDLNLKEFIKLQNEIELLRLNEKELKNELNLKNNQNSTLTNEILRKNDEINTLKAGFEKMQGVLEKTQAFFQQNEKKIDKIPNVFFFL